MFSSKQCQIARLLTQTDTSNIQINEEYQNLLETNAHMVAQELDDVLKEHDMSFDKGSEILADDFANIASKYKISPATAFAIYMHFINK